MQSGFPTHSSWNRSPEGNYVRAQHTIARHHKAADFRELRSLNNSEFAFNPSIDRARIYELAS
jgi:hypothetical protein